MTLKVEHSSRMFHFFYLIKFPSAKHHAMSSSHSMLINKHIILFIYITNK